MIDTSNINQIIEWMKHHKDTLPTYPLEKVGPHLEAAYELGGDGWPSQEIVFTLKDTPQGIPVELAQIILSILQFSTLHNINIVGALDLVIHGLDK